MLLTKNLIKHIEGLEVSQGQGVGDPLRLFPWERRFLHGTVQPVSGLVAVELTGKLEQEIKLSFDGLFASDLSGRARSFGSLVKGGMAIEKAAELAGLLESDE